MFIFDEHSAYYRSPQGALMKGGVLGIRVLSRTTAQAKITAVVNLDGGLELEYGMDSGGINGSYDVLSAEIPFDGSGLFWLRFRIETADNAVFFDKTGVTDAPSQPFQITVYEKGSKTPEWIKGGIMYHIFVDRFCRVGERATLRSGSVYREDWGGVPEFRANSNGDILNNDFFGGSLWGVIEKLPYLEGLGVNCIYLSPVFEAASNHKYDTGDYMKIDSGFGGDEAFAELCSKARERGIRVICDGVFNHVGVDSRYFNRYGNYDSAGAYQSKDSPYYKWFRFREWNNDYESWWNIPLLPALNKDEPEVIEYISGEKGVVRHWIDMGCSGWRLDVVDELPDHYLDPICSAVKEKDPDALIIGEVWEDASNKMAYGIRRRYLLGAQLDSVMNYPLKDAIIAYVKDQNVTVLAETMARLKQNYPKNVLDCLMNILGTHDTMRILTVLGGEDIPAGKEAMSAYRLTDSQRIWGIRLLKLASALQFTLPGIPCVFYGDEAGMEGGSDPFCRGCYPWGNENRELMDWYHKLAGIRRKLAAFKDGEYSLIRARDGVFAFSRGTGCGKVVIAANVSETTQDLGIGGAHREWLTGNTLSCCTAPAASAAVYTAALAQ